MPFDIDEYMGAAHDAIALAAYRLSNAETHAKTHPEDLRESTAQEQCLMVYAALGEVTTAICDGNTERAANGIADAIAATAALAGSIRIQEMAEDEAEKEGAA